jgi:hypothetical protein
MTSPPLPEVVTMLAASGTARAWDESGRDVGRPELSRTPHSVAPVESAQPGLFFLTTIDRRSTNRNARMNTSDHIIPRGRAMGISRGRARRDTNFVRGKLRRRVRSLTRESLLSSVSLPIHQDLSLGRGPNNATVAHHYCVRLCVGFHSVRRSAHDVNGDARIIVSLRGARKPRLFARRTTCSQSVQLGWQGPQCACSGLTRGITQSRESLFCRRV